MKYIKLLMKYNSLELRYNTLYRKAQKEVFKYYLNNTIDMETNDKLVKENKQLRITIKKLREALNDKRRVD